jgi:hypothetical protein
MSFKTFRNIARIDGVKDAASMAKFMGVSLAQVQLWLRLI